MDPASVISAALGVAALCAALLHCGLHQLSGRGREHFWLAVAALGVVQLSVGYSMAYAAESVEEAHYAQTLCLVCCTPLLIGFLRFTALFTGRRLLWIEIPAGVSALVATGITLVAPGLMFGEQLVEARVEWLGHRHVGTEMTILAGVSFVPFFIAFAVVVGIFWIDRRLFLYPRIMVASALLWMGTALSDTLVGFGVYSAPYLLVAGYLVFLMAFTVELVRRYVDSLDRLEESAEELQHVVDERTAALREKDLQVAHGSRMATLGTLAAGLAEEIQEPLGEVMRRIDDVALHFAEPDATAMLDERIGEARRGIERIREIVSRLLHVARQEGGEFGRVDLNRVVEELLLIVRHEARDRARLTTELGEIPEVEGDERLLGQILLNLVLNALHSVPVGREDENQVTVSTGIRDDRVQLIVRDTGNGIPEELRAHVFEPFFTTREPGEGMGLGLPVTRQLVEQHRGSIELSSDERGTTFRVELPALDPSPGSAS
ncbi:MAG: hypothetical protein CL910_14860 [Deltaproteobacteria bacterium]|nr:hypothetical protein [Deltaproteobacteria bacterium]